MGRLTIRRDGHPALAQGYEERFTEQSIAYMLTARLADYEDTCLTPKEVAEYQHLCESYVAAGLDYKFVQFCIDATQNGLSLEVLQELAQAEKDGRLVVLPPNDPLTLEELRHMGGKPYWHVGLQEDSPPPHWNVLDPFYAQRIEDYGYGKRWLAYRYEEEDIK